MTEATAPDVPEDPTDLDANDIPETSENEVEEYAGPESNPELTVEQLPSQDPEATES